MTMFRAIRSVALTALIVSSCIACKRSDAVAKDSSAAPVASAAVPSGSPLSRLIPPARPGPRSACPLTIEPGVAFGPILLGETVADLVAAGLTVKNVTDTHAEVVLHGVDGTDPTLKVTLCQGKIIDIWIDDLRKAPTCVTYAGAPVASSIAREDLEKAFGGCSDAPPRIGGSFEGCQSGGVYVGHGLGTFLQIRVRPKGLPFDNACEIASDDGSLITLSADERKAMFRQTLNLSQLSPYWHVDLPGRDPLRIVKTSLVPEQELMMFGSQVVWIDESEAKKGTAFLRITGLSATKTKATLTFEYPIEGVTGTAAFAHVPSSHDWRLERGEVRER
jgi:hypothetical protein